METRNWHDDGFGNVLHDMNPYSIFITLYFLIGTWEPTAKDIVMQEY